MPRLTRYTFGATAGVVTSMGLIVGLEAAHATKAMLVSGLLIVALADNISDSLGIHMYQEAEKLEPREAFRATLSNFATRLLLCLSFVGVVVVLSPTAGAIAALIWGAMLLIALSIAIARERRVRVLSEVLKHVVTAVGVIAVSRIVSGWISALVR